MKHVKTMITDNREEWREKHNFYKFFQGMKLFGRSIMESAKDVEPDVKKKDPKKRTD